MSVLYYLFNTSSRCAWVIGPRVMNSVFSGNLPYNLMKLSMVEGDVKTMRLKWLRFTRRGFFGSSLL